MIKEFFQHGFSNGCRYGLREGLTKTFSSESSYEDSESAFADGALPVIMGLAAVLISLILTATILGLFSKSAGNLGMKAVFNATITQIDGNAQSAYSLGSIIPIVVIGVGILGVIFGVFFGQ